MTFVRDLWKHLERKSKSDGRDPRGNPGEQTVIKTAAAPEPVALSVKTQSRHDKTLRFPQFRVPGAGHRL